MSANQGRAGAQAGNCNSLSAALANAVSLPFSGSLVGISSTKTNSILANSINSQWIVILITVFFLK